MSLRRKIGILYLVLSIIIAFWGLITFNTLTPLLWTLLAVGAFIVGGSVLIFGESSSKQELWEQETNSPSEDGEGKGTIELKEEDFLLSQFIDIMNEHGLRSPKVEEFLLKHAHNEEFVTLAHGAAQIHVMCLPLREGYTEPVEAEMQATQNTLNAMFDIGEQNRHNGQQFELKGEKTCNLKML